jgi:hypothetical protein
MKSDEGPTGMCLDGHENDLDRAMH